LIYVTCSLFAEENEDRVAAFLGAQPAFAPASAPAAIDASGLATPEGLQALAPREQAPGFLRLSPLSAGADGFFVAVLERAS